VARVLLVSQYYSPDITAAAHRITDLRRYLQSRGHEVDVITSFPHKAQVAQVEVEEEVDKGVARVRLPSGATSTFARLWEQLTFSAKALGAFLVRFRNRKYNYIIASSPPLFVGVVGRLLATWTGAGLILDIRDIWPGSVAAAGVFRGSSLPIRVASRLERWLYRVADYITCVSQPMKEYLQQYVNPSIVWVVYNGVNITPPGPYHNEATTKDYTRGRKVGYHSSDERMDGTICLAYAGNIGLVQDIDVLVQALAYVRSDTLKRLQIRIIGSGPERNRLEAVVARDPVASRIISFEGPYAKNELDRILYSSVDALFIHLRSDPVLDRTIPSKVFDSCVYNLPIVYGLSGEGKEILGRLSGTLSFSQGSPESLAAALDELVQRYKVYWVGAQRHRSYVERHFTRERCFEPILRILSNADTSSNQS